MMHKSWLAEQHSDIQHDSQLPLVFIKGTAANSTSDL